MWIKHSGGELGCLCHASSLSHPADPAPGHNPLGLDEWTVETHRGGRLLALEEISQDRTTTADIQRWDVVACRWSPGAAGGWSLDETYRTFKPPGYFLPQPKTRVIRQGELPEVFLWKEKEDIRPNITHRASWTLEEIESAARDGWQWSRSLDGPWRLFTVPVDESQYAEKEQSK